MNYEYLKKKMDKFFNTVTTEKLVEDLKKVGYSFSEFNESDYQNIDNDVVCHSSLNELTPITTATFSANDAGEYSYAMAA